MEDRKKIIGDLNKLLDELPVALTEEQQQKRDEIKDMLNKIEKIPVNKQDDRSVDK